MTEPNPPSPLPRLPIQRFPNVDQLQRTVADAFCEAVSITLKQQDSFRVALSGGSTPKRLYELLAERELPWDQIHWFWGDERNVSDNHSESNAKMVKTALLDRVPAPAMNIHPIAVEPQVARPRSRSAVSRSATPSRKACTTTRATLRGRRPDQEWLRSQSSRGSA